MYYDEYYEEDEFYDDYNEGEISEIKGITDTVTDYTYTNLNYPCIVFKDGISIERHKVNVISNMVKGSIKGIDKDISLYFSKDGQMYKLGSISGSQVSNFLDIVGLDNVSAYLSDKEELKGSLIYTLCTMLC